MHEQVAVCEATADLSSWAAAALAVDHCLSRLTTCLCPHTAPLLPLSSKMLHGLRVTHQN
jgi:hypothetical protein